MSNQQKDTSRSDTTAPAGAQPVQGQSGKVGSQVAGQGGGTDAAAGASMGGDFGQGQRRQDTDAAGSPGSPGASLGGDALSPGAGAAVAAPAWVKPTAPTIPASAPAAAKAPR